MLVIWGILSWYTRVPALLVKRGSFIVVRSTSDPLVERYFSVIVPTYLPFFSQKRRENDLMRKDQIDKTISRRLEAWWTPGNVIGGRVNWAQRYVVILFMKDKPLSHSASADWVAQWLIVSKQTDDRRTTFRCWLVSRKGNCKCSSANAERCVDGKIKISTRYLSCVPPSPSKAYFGDNRLSRKSIQGCVVCLECYVLILRTRSKQQNDERLRYKLRSKQSVRLRWSQGPGAGGKRSHVWGGVAAAAKLGRFKEVEEAAET